MQLVCVNSAKRGNKLISNETVVHSGIKTTLIILLLQIIWNPLQVVPPCKYSSSSESSSGT